MSQETIHETAPVKSPAALTPTTEEAAWQHKYNEQRTSAEAPIPPSDFEALYTASQAENKRLQDVLAASRLSSIPLSQTASVKPAVTASRVKALLGPLALLKMTRDEKLQSLGVDPASVTDDGLKKIFGRGNDGKMGGDLQKTSPARYAQLREAALLLNVYGA